MKNITKNYTLFTFEELSEKAKDKVRNSINLDAWDWGQAATYEEFENLFDKYGYNYESMFDVKKSSDICEFVGYAYGGGQICGKLEPYGVYNAICENHGDEDLKDEIEMLLTNTYLMDIKVTSGGEVNVFGEGYIYQLTQGFAETNEEREILADRLTKAISRIEEIVKEDFRAMSEEYLVIKKNIEDFHCSNECFDNLIDCRYEGKECFLKDGTLFE